MRNLSLLVVFILGIIGAFPTPSSATMPLAKYDEGCQTVCVWFSGFSTGHPTEKAATKAALDSAADIAVIYLSSYKHVCAFYVDILEGPDCEQAEDGTWSCSIFVKLTIEYIE